jgi:hypothetical protein
MIWDKDNRPLYSLDEVALLFGVCRDTIRKRGRLSGVPRRIVHRVRYYTEEDLRQMCNYDRPEEGV